MAKKIRSPSYPAVALDAAVGLLEKIYPAATHPLGIEVIGEQWDYTSVSSSSPYVAALKKYGLLEEVKEGADRMLKLTERALDIAVDPQGETSEGRQAIQEAALSPAIHREMWEKWGAQLPPDGEIRRYLQRERKFNPSYVLRVLSIYKKTIDFAKLIGNDIDGNGNDGDDNTGADESTKAHSRSTRKKGREKTPDGMNEDVYTLSHGDAVLQWPSHISTDELDEVEGWLHLMLRKMKRTVASDDDGPTVDDE